MQIATQLISWSMFKQTSCNLPNVSYDLNWWKQMVHNVYIFEQNFNLRGKVKVKPASGRWSIQLEFIPVSVA